MELFGTEDPSEAAVKIRNVSQWSKPRQKLSFTVHGQEMIPSSTKNLDSRNGPLPGPMRLRHMPEQGFVVDLSIVSHWAESTPNDQAGAILSSRWRDDVTIDRDLLSKRTRRGKVIVSSSSYYSPGGQGTTDGLRETLVTCSIDPGFVRESSHYDLAENGLELSYELVDQELFRMFPDGTTGAVGTMITGSQIMGTPGRPQIVSVTLKGPKLAASSPQQLISQATAIATLKGRLNGGFFPTKATFKENLWNPNEVTVTLEGMAKKPTGANAQVFLGIEATLNGFGQIVAGQIGATSPGAGGVTATLGTRGSANILLHAAAYQDPTLAKTLNKMTNSIVQGASRQNPLGAASKVPGG